MIAAGPPPAVSTFEALRSETARSERDRQLAAWCGLNEDELGPFLRRLREYDARTPAWREREALEELGVLRALRAKAEDNHTTRRAAA